MALVKHPHWYQFLRYSEPGENGAPTTPFRELIRKMPGKHTYNSHIGSHHSQMVEQHEVR